MTTMDEPYGLRYPTGQPVTGWEAQVKRFRHKPMVVEAFGPIIERMVVSTPQGPRMAEPGDYIVTRASANEMYPVKPWVFEYVYDRAPDGTPVDMSGRGPRG